MTKVEAGASLAPPSRSVGRNAPTEPGQNFLEPLGELWCLFTLVREEKKGRKEGKESGSRCASEGE